MATKPLSLDSLDQQFTELFASIKPHEKPYTFSLIPSIVANRQDDAGGMVGMTMVLCIVDA